MYGNWIENLRFNLVYYTYYFYCWMKIQLLFKNSLFICSYDLHIKTTASPVKYDWFPLQFMVRNLFSFIAYEVYMDTTYKHFNCLIRTTVHFSNARVISSSNA